MHHAITYLHSAGLEVAEHLNTTDKIGYYTKLVVPVEELCQRMADRFDSRWADVEASIEADPRRLAGSGMKAHRYARWMGLSFMQGEEPCWLAHADVVMRRGLHQTLMRFRLMCWDLEVNWPQGRVVAVRAAFVVMSKPLKMNCMCCVSALLTSPFETGTRVISGLRSGICVLS